MNLITVREAAKIFDNIILAKNKIAAIDNIVRRYKIYPVVPATGKTPDKASKYDADELEDAIEECYDNIGNYRASASDLQNIDFRTYDAKDSRYENKPESYLTTYSLSI